MTVIAYERDVNYYETDRMDCVHHSNYIRWFEEARLNFLKESGFPFMEMEDMGLFSPVLRVEAEYKAMCRFGDTVVIETRIERYTGTRLTWCYEVKDRDTGALCCRGRTENCFMNASGRPVALRKAAPEYDEAIKRICGEAQDDL